MSPSRKQALAYGELECLPFDVDRTTHVSVRIGESIAYGSLLAEIITDSRLSQHLGAG